MYELGRVRDIVESRGTMQMLPGVGYTDPNVYQADLDLIFHRDWIFIGHTFELAEPGQFMTVQIGDYPVFLIRARDGELRAYHNVCRHRGSRVLLDERGKASRLVCPYHQWMYDHSGKLLNAPTMGADLDKSEYGLKPVHCETVGTYIFVCVANEAPDFSEFKGIVAPYINAHNLENAKVAHESTIVEQGNWKLVWENNRECYHCESNHPELLRSFLEDPSTVAANSNAGPSEDVLARWNEWESQGIPSKMLIGHRGDFRITRVPMVEGTSSFTMSGQPAVTHKPLVDADDVNMGDLLLNLYPSTWNHFLGDHAISFRVLPLSPTQTQLTTKWLVNKDAVEGKDYDLKALTEVWEATNREDQGVVEEAARGSASPAFEPGPLSPQMEVGVEHFLKWYCNTMSERLPQ